MGEPERTEVKLTITARVPTWKDLKTGGYHTYKTTYTLEGSKTHLLKLHLDARGEGGVEVKVEGALSKKEMLKIVTEARDQSLPLAYIERRINEL